MASKSTHCLIPYPTGLFFIYYLNKILPSWRTIILSVKTSQSSLYSLRISQNTIWKLPDTINFIKIRVLPEEVSSIVTQWRYFHYCKKCIWVMIELTHFFMEVVVCVLVHVSSYMQQLYDAHVNHSADECIPVWQDSTFSCVCWVELLLAAHGSYWFLWKVALAYQW